MKTSSKVAPVATHALYAVTCSHCLSLHHHPLRVRYLFHTHTLLTLCLPLFSISFSLLCVGRPRAPPTTRRFFPLSPPMAVFNHSHISTGFLLFLRQSFSLFLLTGLSYTLFLTSTFARCSNLYLCCVYVNIYIVVDSVRGLQNQFLISPALVTIQTS